MLNPSKTQFVLLRRPGKELPPGTAVNCRGTSIAPSAYARYLGILVDEHLSFSTQVDAVCATVNRKVGAFVHAKQNISIFGKRLFYLSIIQSTFEFGSTAYIHCLSQTLYDKLLTASRVALKRIFSLDRMTPTTLLYSHTNLYALEKRLNFKTYVFVYRCLNGLASPLLRDRFTLRAHGARTAAITRGQVSAALVLPPANTRYGFSAISYLGAARWNTLPPACRMSSSPAEFRSSIKLYLGFPVKRR